MNCKNADTAGNPCSTKTCPYCAVIRRKLPSVDALKEELRVTEQNLADCMARLHAYDCKVDALIAEIMDCEINGHYGDTGYDVGQVNAVLDKYRSAK